jgi:pilus assembly protein Flp/PilA
MAASRGAAIAVGEGIGTLTWIQLRRPKMAKFLKLIKNDKGATAIEYGLIAALIAVACITALTSVGGKLSGTFNNISTAIN